jgi:hypothetical protein
LKKNQGRKERRRLVRQERLEQNKQARMKVERETKKAMRQGITTQPKPIEDKTANFNKQNTKWFNKRKKVTMTRLWAKKKAS